MESSRDVLPTPKRTPLQMAIGNDWVELGTRTQQSEGAGFNRIVIRAGLGRSVGVRKESPLDKVPQSRILHLLGTQFIVFSSG